MKPEFAVLGKLFSESAFTLNQSTNYFYQGKRKAANHHSRYGGVMVHGFIIWCYRRLGCLCYTKVRRIIGIVAIVAKESSEAIGYGVYRIR